MAMAPEQAGLGIRRHFTTPGVHPYDEVEWEHRDARISNFRDGTVAFEQLDVEFPVAWSQNATNIVAQKYFRGPLGSPERESSLRQVIDRVVNTVTEWGVKDGYFVDDAEAETFRAELTHVLVHQKAAFNSPVWFNIGVAGEPQQASACQPYDALVSTPDGLIPIGQLVETNAVGTKVFDANGLTKIVAVKANGRKSVLRIHTKAGYTLDVTPDHLVWRVSGMWSGEWVEAGALRRGDLLEWHGEDRWGTVGIREIEEFGEMDVYDIQTESGEYLSGGLRVHNCFILAVDDTMQSILNWYVEEGTIFKGGSGSGINLSKLRSSREHLKGGGTASGPVSFMRGADASAGTIKSGGKTRRAAKMVVLNADHPDVEDFIWCKAVEERKARVLRDAGFDMDLDGKDSHSTQYQNANNSVRVTDEFMQAVVDDADWHLRAVKDGRILQTIKARALFREIAEAAWECADPGMQFDTTINRWHTAANTDRINASNPCCFVGETLIDTDAGLLRFELLHKMGIAGEELPSVRSLDVGTGQFVRRAVKRVWIAGETDRIVEVHTSGGLTLRSTPDHRYLTADGFVEAAELRNAAVLRGVSSAGVSRSETVVSVREVSLDESVPVYDLEVEDTHNFAVTSEGAPAATRAVIVHNSEYMHLDNSACNLASLNLLKFLRADGSFDVEAFRGAVEVVFTAQEILVGNADYPTPSIAETSRRFRQLGLGYANLGAMLMALGMPYDSDDGRAWAAAITALMTGHAYATSARTAARMGPFAGYTENQEPMNRVLRMHRDEVAKIDEALVPTELLSAAQESWDVAVDTAELCGVRNSQATVLAPTGCLVGGSLIPTDRGLVRLRSLGDTEGAEWQDLSTLVATNEGPRQADKFYVNGLEPVVTVKTQRGYRIQGTPQHRVKTVDPTTGDWRWRHFADVRPGDMVPLALDQLVGDPRVVALPASADDHLDTPPEMTAELAELVGFFMGRGDIDPEGLRLEVDVDFDVADHLQHAGKELFGMSGRVAVSASSATVTFASTTLAEWWVAAGLGKRHGEAPHVPDAVLATNDAAVYTAFLRGVFEAAGTVVSGQPHWSTTSVEFSYDVQSLLLALGHPTARKLDAGKVAGSPDAPAAVLRLLNPSYNQAWLDEVGFVGHRKNDAVILDAGHDRFPRDRVPVSPELIERLAPHDDELRRALLMQSRKGTVSRRLATELFGRNADPELGQLLGFVYDTVASIETGDEELTYDISVPDNVTYIANGFVSHNTIGLMMDCDTTGIEPDLGLCKTKKLVGGGTMSIVNQTVPRALRRLGYDDNQVADIASYIDEHKSIIGAPHLSPDHLAVFACSMGDNAIHYTGHVRMMGAVQPWISGAISKTVNMPETVTVEEVEQLHIDAWKMGVKAVAIYRDNCKVAQPLAMTKKEPALAAAGAEVSGFTAQAEMTASADKLAQLVREPTREKLPRKRNSQTFSFRVADCHGYVTVGEYDDGRPGEIFLRVAKQGSTLAGVMDAFAISVSHGLQYGVPLKAFVEMFTNMRFEPAGMTDDPDLRIASSLVDYIFRRLAVDYLRYEDRAELGILTVPERMQPTLPGVEEMTTPTSTGSEIIPDPAPPAPVVLPATSSPAAVQPTAADAPYCFQCGNVMQRAGSCYVCGSCGTTSGCS